MILAATDTKGPVDGALLYLHGAMVTKAHEDAEGELLARYCQLKRPWYARRVRGAAARVGGLFCSPIMLPHSSRAGPEKGALGPLS
jgi:hypothetical protein